MSDPYAAALGLAEPPNKPASAADWAAASAAQKFGSDSAAIAAQEVSQAKTPADRAAALKTQAYTNAKIAQQDGTPAVAANDPYASALGLDGSGKPVQAPKSAAAADGMPPMPPKGATGPDPYSDALYAKTGSGDYTRPGESWWDAYSRNSTYSQQQRDAGKRQPADPLKVVGNAVSGLAGSVAGGLRGLFGGGADAVTKTQEGLNYTPSDPESRAVSEMANGAANPLNWPAIAGDKVGSWLGEHGMPGTGAAVATAGAALPMVVGLKPARAAIARSGTLLDLKGPDAPVARIEPTMEPQAAPSATSALSNNPSPTLAEAVPGMPPPPMKLAPKQSVPGNTEPFPGKVGPTSQPPKPTFSDPANNVFAESAPDVKGGLPLAEQQRRAAVLSEIGLSDARRSAVTGDANQAAIDFQTSRLKGSPGGDFMSQQLAREKQAITDYADGIAQKTGGSALNDQSAKLARGEAILTPLEGLKEWYDNQTSALYKEADERAQGVPTQLDNFRTVLGDDSLATNSDRVNLRTAASAYAKKLGIVDDQGNVFANAQQAETMRKYLNENWSPANSGLVAKLKDALDQDVMSAAGEDVYGQARALRAQRAATLDNPNGIAKLLDSSGPQGVNRSVPVEKVADAITNMPVAQLKNITETLRNMPLELQPMAQDALAEIKAQYAHNVRDIGASQQGQWNAKGVQKYLSNNSARMQAVFSPEEMKRFGTLNDAGNILAKDQSYPGAYAQQQNLLRAGVSHAITSGSTAAGAAIGGAPGAVVGNVLGGKAASKFNDASTLRATQKRMVTLSNLTDGGKP